jgi:prolipoprotein diacylglyceryltransferase
MRCTVLITILTSAFADTIMASMIAKGWVVAPVITRAGNFLTVESYGNLGDIVSFTVHKAVDDKPVNSHNEIKAAVQDVLKEKDISYFSVIVVTEDSADWSPGNIPRAVTEVVPSSWERLNSAEEIK